MNPRIIIDTRELNSPIPKLLERLNAEISFDTISVGDYVLSRRVGVERKSAEDFLKSWIDEKKIWSQLRDLEVSYEIPLLIIEGFTDSLYTMRQVHPRAIQGILRSIMVGMRIPIVWSLDAADTASWLYEIAKSEQDTDKKKYFSWHGKRSHLSANEQREYVVAAIPDLGVTTARKLLEHFKSVQNVFNATKENLQEVVNVGPKTAERIKEVVCSEYK